MGMYRKLARSKKGMSTIFGALFFVILILMGFNLMIWGFIQMDAYNSITTSMSQRDQTATSENLVPTNPGATDFAANAFNITVNNLGGSSVIIARIYIFNISPTGTTPTLCAGSNAPCIVDPSTLGTGYSFTKGNIPVGVINAKITVNGLVINDGSGYQVILSSTRGRQFSFFYPWPQPIVNGGQGNFVTNIGPLAIYFDFKSFNFTQGSQTSSNTAFCVPSSTSIVFWVKISNTATDSSVKLEPQTMMQMQPYGANGFGQFVRMWIDDPGTVNPNNVVGYNFNTNPYNLPAANPNGPSGFTIVKFSASSQGSADAQSMRSSDNWITFIGFYYFYRGQLQGQTIPFMDFKSVSSYPSGC
jgi:hypothetical protein